MLPNEDGMKTIQNVWIKLVPELDSHDTFYYFTGKQEEIYNTN